MADADELYEEAAAVYGAALGAYEADPDKRRDLLQEIHLAVWRSFAHFAQRCSLRTWILSGSDRRTALEHLLRVIQRLKPLDRQVMLSYLEGMDAASIAELPVSQKRTAWRMTMTRRTWESFGAGSIRRRAGCPPATCGVPLNASKRRSGAVFGWLSLF